MLAKRGGRKKLHLCGVRKIWHFVTSDLKVVEYRCSSVPSVVRPIFRWPVYYLKCTCRVNQRFSNLISIEHTYFIVFL